jgi:hypothetical protein
VSAVELLNGGGSCRSSAGPLLHAGGVKRKEANSIQFASSQTPSRELDRPDVFGLPAFRPFSDAELNGLTLLQALKPARLDRREMYKNVFAILAADEAIALGVVEPLYCSLFHDVVLVFLFLNLRWKESEELCAGDLLLKARAAHDRIGLTYTQNRTLDGKG